MKLKSIRELHEMLIDMAILIESQGELIDRIEHHVGNSRTYIESAPVKIRNALVYQGKARTVSLIKILVMIKRIST